MMDKKDPLVSIVTIVYNGEKYLEQTIQSVLDQTYSNIEYIIIDGGSTDNTINIIKKHSAKLAYWLSEKDNGISDAFNKGISRATGEIIGLINADDWYEKDAVEKTVNAIQHHDISYGDIAYWKNGKRDMVVQGQHNFLRHEMTLNHPTVFIKKNCYKKFGAFNNNYKLAMDYELLLRLKFKNCSFVHIPSIIANMRWDGASDKHWLKACNELLEVKNKYMPRQRLVNTLYFYKQVTAILASRFLQKLHLGYVVRFYRRAFSPIKKTYH